MRGSLRAAGLTAAVAVLAPLLALTADTRVPPSSTQAPASRLLDSAAVVAASTRLASSDRVKVVTIGRSAGGRPIPMLVITAPGGTLEEWRRRAHRIAGPAIRYTSLANAAVERPSLADELPGTRLPVLLAGASWGHEAAQVEGLLAAAEYLATDRSPATERVLQRTVVLIVPLMNPDGRDRAIVEWRRRPLSNGDSAVGNDRGFMLNRDFVHQTQPESQALLDVTRDWRPVVGIDLHEDVNRLGLAVPEMAFVPPFMPGFDVEEDPAFRRAIVKVGGAIAARWRAAGHQIVHDPEGDRKWVPLPARESGELNPVAGSSGRLEFLWNIHSIAGLITESARTPGTQTWESRVDQKKLAALAAAEVVAGDPEFFARTVYTRRAAATTDADKSFIAIPHAQPAGADRLELIRLLRAHDVLVYHAAAHPFDVVPLAQPEAPFVRHVLLAERSKLNDLTSALGVTIAKSADLPAAERSQLSAAKLELYDRREIAWPRAPRAATVAVYSGQGVDRATSGEILLVLNNAGFAAVPVDEEALRRGAMPNVRAIVFGDGASTEIVNGWDAAAATRRAPWQPADERRGIGSQGQAALAAFVRGGGHVITIGRSAGVVAPSLVDVAINGARPGIGEVRVAIAREGEALFAGVPTASRQARAFLSAAPGPGEGGYLLDVRSSGSGAPIVLAWYAGADDRPVEQSFTDVAPLVRAADHAAIVSATAGRGRVTLFGFSPVFRAQWRSTFPLLFNAIGGA